MATYCLAGDGGSQIQPLFWEKNNMMKTIKTAICATAALTAMSTLALADPLSDLKSVFQNLTARDAASQAAVQAPDGFRVYPTADAVATDAAVEEPFVEVKTSGYIKTGYIYSQVKDGIPLDNSSDFDVEAGVNVKGSVQSAIGEIGTTIQVKWDTAESTTNLASIALRDEGIIGFWQFTDTLKLETGRSNAGRLENGIDKNTKRLWTFANRRVRAENAGDGFFDRDAYNAFFGLAYSEGPLSLTARIHDATRGVKDGAGKTGFDDDAIGASAKGVFTSELFSLEMAGGYWGQDDAKNLPIDKQTGVKWLAGVGTELDFIPGLPISIGAQSGRLHNGAKSMKVSGSVGFTLTDNITAGFGAGWNKISASPNVADNRSEKMLHGEIYYAPMSQLIIGLEADYYDDGRPKVAAGAIPASNDGFTGAVVTRYAF
jgi:hypothetical protein